MMAMATTTRPPPRLNNTPLPTFLILLVSLLSQSFASSETAPQQGKSQAEAVLTSLPEHDNIRRNATDVARVGNVDVATTADGRKVGFCHLAVMMPFSQIPPGAPGRVPLPHGYESAFAASLAAHHLNTGDGVVVPEVKGLDGRCDVRFTVELFDTELSQSRAVEETIGLLGRDVRGGGDRDRPRPSAFLGNTRSAVSLATSVITGLAGYPQLSPISVSSQLDDKSQHPLFGRVIPSSDGHAFPIVKFFREELNVRHLGIVHNNDGYGNAYARAVLKAAQEHAPDMTVKFIDIPVNAAPEDYEGAVRFLKSTQFRHFFGAVLYFNYEPLMEEAYRQGVAGTGVHNWMFSTSIERAMRGRYERDSPLHLATRGASMINVMGGKPGTPAKDAFELSWAELNNARDVEYVASKLPRHEDDPDYDSAAFVGDAFFDAKGGTVGPFVYDIAVSLGLAACAAAEENGGGEPSFDGPLHFQKVLETRFNGVTGRIVFEEGTGNRDPTSALFVLLNMVEDPNATDSDGNNPTLVDIVQTRPYIFEDGQWANMAPFLFNDGTGMVPPDLPEASVDWNYIGGALRAVGLALSSAIMALSVGFSAWTEYNRSSHVVRASQPIFLHIICFGVFLMGATIVPLSFDDEATSARDCSIACKGCSIACMSVPWLLCIGFATAFSALLSKTWRTNKIFHNPRMRRIKVTPLDVMIPLFASLAVNALVLSLWTSLSPLQWKREVVDVDEFDRVINSHGSCKSVFYLPYVIVLVVVNIGVLMFAVHQAYIARSISTEFAESEYIAKALAVTMLVCLIAIPVMIIVTDEPRAYFFVMTSIITVLCVSLLLFIFVPKVVFHRDKNRDKGQSAVRGFVKRTFTREINASMASVESGVVKRTSMEAKSMASSEFDVTTSGDKDSEGMIVLDHPKMRESVMVENVELRRRVAELESLLEAVRQKSACQDRAEGNRNEPIATRVGNSDLENFASN